MIRILGNNLENNKKIIIALTQIYGIGLSTSKKILLSLKINENKKVFELSETEVGKLRDYLESGSFKLEGNLRRYNGLNIKRLIEIKSYRGIRILKGLPSRGQRTRTNSRTARKINSTLIKTK